jgi:hypothetical protein
MRRAVLFLRSPENACKKAHASGIRRKAKKSPVRGLFEIHPVTTIEVAEN